MDSNNSTTNNNELPPDAPVPRLCHLFKWPDFDGFGFNLQVGHFIGKVDDDSPAQHADLREGDRIIEVNNVPISNENHKQVVQRIKNVPDETLLLVIEQSAYHWYKERDLVIRSTQSNIVHCKTPVPRPRSNDTNEQLNSMDKQQMNGKIDTPLDESISISLNVSTNPSTKGSIDGLTNSTISERSSLDQQNSLIADEILKESKGEQKNTISGVDQITKQLKSSKIQENETNQTIEHNNNSEKAANQNLVQQCPVVVKITPQKTHNFIVVDSEAEFEAEKRLKNEQMKNSAMTTSSTPKKSTDKQSAVETNSRHYLNLSSASSITSSTSTTQQQTTSSANSFDCNELNLNMSASEMRKLIESRRKNVKVECKKSTMDLRQKYEIIQQM